MTALNNLTSIEGHLNLYNNDNLANLSGLDFIAAASIVSLYIRNNSSLASCEVESVCDYLASPVGTIDISNNASGCDSSAEVIEACATAGTGLMVSGRDISIYPNPAKDVIYISYRNEREINELKLYNHLGQLVFRKYRQVNSINTLHFQPGLYFLEIVSGQKHIRWKIVIGIP